MTLKQTRWPSSEGRFRSGSRWPGVIRPERMRAEAAAASDKIGELDRELQRLRDGLLAGLPSDTERRSTEQQARFVLAHMMEFHRREDLADPIVDRSAAFI